MDKSINKGVFSILFVSFLFSFFLLYCVKGSHAVLYWILALVKSGALMTSSSSCAKPNNYVCLFKIADFHNSVTRLLSTRGFFCYVYLWRVALSNVLAVTEPFNSYFTTYPPSCCGFRFLCFSKQRTCMEWPWLHFSCTVHSNKWIMLDQRFMICTVMQILDKVSEGICWGQTSKNLTSVFWLLYPALRMLLSLGSHPLASSAPVKLQLFQWKAEANRAGPQ